MTAPLAIRSGTARAYTVPTDAPEADGTFVWNSTTLVVVTLHAGDVQGIGYTYSHKLVAKLADELIQKDVVGFDPFESAAIFSDIRRHQRNYGRQGIAAAALSAIDIALWDLKAKLIGKPLVALLGGVRAGAPVYGSGGFTTYSDRQIQEQLGGWVAAGIPAVKMKIGRDPEDDPRRVRQAREVIGARAELFVDANGAYSVKQALRLAKQFVAEANVTWFEEPVSSDDVTGLRLIREQSPPGMDIAAGEYAWDTMDLKRLIEAGAVDVLQADATRCGGITGFMQAAALCEAHPLPLSAHCGPTAHMHAACAAPVLRHIEYFHDHVRIESILFDGFRPAENGVMTPDLSRPGLGIEFKQEDAEQFADD